MFEFFIHACIIFGIIFMLVFQLNVLAFLAGCLEFVIIYNRRRIF